MNMKEIKKQWAIAVNDKDNKPYRDKTYGTKYTGKINAIHFMLYNLVRGLPLDRGFDTSKDSYKHTYRLLRSYLRYTPGAFNFLFNHSLVTREELKELAEKL